MPFRGAARRGQTAGWLRVLSSRLATVRLPRPVQAAGFAGVLALATSAAVLGAAPGSAFYDARIAFEDATLPTQPGERLAAHEEHLQARLAEAQTAATAGNTAALAAALGAYDVEVAVALAEIRHDPELLAQLEAMLAKHVAVLVALEAQLPEQASIDVALANSQRAIETINDTTGSGSPSSPAGDGASEPQGPEPGGGPEPAEEPATGGKPAPTEEPKGGGKPVPTEEPKGGGKPAPVEEEKK